MKMNRSGKALTVFLIVITVLLLCITGISVFFFLKEIELHKADVAKLEQLQSNKAQIDAELKEVKLKANKFELQIQEMEKAREGLEDELELEKEIKTKAQQENRDLQAALEKEKSVQDELRQQLGGDLTKAEETITSLKTELEKTAARNKELEDQSRQLESDIVALKEELKKWSDSPASNSPSEPTAAPVVPEQDPMVDLEKIVVTPDAKGGRVVSVDAETGFLVANLGEMNGIKPGIILSVFRGESYIGDVKVTRVLPEMSAADFVPPLSGDQVQKDDQIVVKQ